MPKVVKGRTASISYFGELVSLHVPDHSGRYGMIHILTLPTTEFKKLYQELLAEEAALAAEMSAADEARNRATFWLGDKA